MMKLKYFLDQCKLAQIRKLHENPYEISVNLVYKVSLGQKLANLFRFE